MPLSSCSRAIGQPSLQFGARQVSGDARGPAERLHSACGRASALELERDLVQRLEVFVLWHNHDLIEDECACAQFCQDSKPYATFGSFL